MGKGRYKKNRNKKKTKKRIRLTRIQDEMTLTFQHLYDDKFGVIVDTRQRYSWDRRTLIVPSEFVPRLGESYDCYVSMTGGFFTYNNEEFKLAIAVRKDGGNIIDEIEYKFGKIGEEKSEPEFSTNLGAIAKFK